MAYTLAVRRWFAPPTMVAPSRLGWRPLPTSLSDESSFADEGVFANLPSVVQRAFRRLLRSQPVLFAFDSLLATAFRFSKMARTLAASASSSSIPVTRSSVYVSAVVPSCQFPARLTLVQAAEDLLIHLARSRPSWKWKEGETLSYVLDLAFHRAAAHGAAHVMPKDIARGGTARSSA